MLMICRFDWRHLPALHPLCLSSAGERLHLGHKAFLPRCMACHDTLFLCDADFTWQDR